MHEVGSASCLSVKPATHTDKKLNLRKPLFKTIPPAMLVLLMALRPMAASALGEPKYVHTSPTQGEFVLESNGRATPLVVSDKDWPGVIRAVGDLAQDVGRVTGHDAPVVTDAASAKDEIVLIGTIGKSP
jgi:hypothetical protein